MKNLFLIFAALFSIHTFSTGQTIAGRLEIGQTYTFESFSGSGMFISYPTAPGRAGLNAPNKKFKAVAPLNGKSGFVSLQAVDLQGEVYLVMAEGCPRPYTASNYYNATARPAATDATFNNNASFEVLAGNSDKQNANLVTFRVKNGTHFFKREQGVFMDAPGAYLPAEHATWKTTKIPTSGLPTLNSLAELNVTATAVQFKNVATGQYIVLLPSSGGGGGLEASASPEATPWYFYQGPGAPANSVEVKRKPVDGFNWSNYDQKTDENSSIAWNHAKRIPNATAPNGPHAWTIEEVSVGVFRMKWAHSGEYLELMPNMKLVGGNGPKIITRPLDAANKHQQWIIEVNKKKGSSTPSIVGTWTFDTGGSGLATLVFNADKTGTLTLNGTTGNLTYEQPDAQTLVVTADGATESNKIISLDATTMVIEDINNQKITMTRK